MMQIYSFFRYCHSGMVYSIFTITGEKIVIDHYKKSYDYCLYIIRDINIQNNDVVFVVEKEPLNNFKEINTEDHKILASELISCINDSCRVSLPKSYLSNSGSTVEYVEIDYKNRQFIIY